MHGAASAWPGERHFFGVMFCLFKRKNPALAGSIIFFRELGNVATLTLRLWNSCLSLFVSFSTRFVSLLAVSVYNYIEP